MPWVHVIWCLYDIFLCKSTDDNMWLSMQFWMTLDDCMLWHIFPIPFISSLIVLPCIERFPTNTNSKRTNSYIPSILCIFCRCFLRSMSDEVVPRWSQVQANTWRRLLLCLLETSSITTLARWMDKNWQKTGWISYRERVRKELAVDTNNGVIVCSSSCHKASQPVCLKYPGKFATLCY